MDYTITDILKADLESRYKFFKNRPELFLLNMLMVVAIGFPICNIGISFMSNMLGMGMVIGIILTCVLYWVSSLFWAWRIIRLFTKQ